MQRANTFASLLICAAAAATCSAPLSALAQQAASMPGMNNMTHMSSTAEAQSAPASGKTATGDSTAAFKAADERMMTGMQGTAYTGNADEDFVAHMTPPHQGAVEMAQIELKYGKDAQLKRLAQNIISSQRKEIEFMKQWQAKHGAR